MSNIRLFPADWLDSTHSSINSGLGLGKISDAISCKVTEERNGKFELEMEYPVTGIRYSDLAIRMFIVAPPNPFDDPQLFRIYSISKEYKGIVTINAQHVSYDLSDVIIKTGRITNDSLDPYIIWTYVKNNLATNFTMGKFTFSSDLTVDDSIEDEDGEKITKWQLKGPKSVKNILLGNGDDSFMNLYIGDDDDSPEYTFNNLSISLDKHRGKNRNVTIRYGKNMTGFNQTESLEKIYTHIYPYYYASSLTYYNGGYGDGTQVTANDWACDLSDWTDSAYTQNPLMATGIKDKDGNDLNFKHVLPVDVTSLYGGDLAIDLEKMGTIADFNQFVYLYFQDWDFDWGEDSDADIRNYRIKAGQSLKVVAIGYRGQPYNDSDVEWWRDNSEHDASHYTATDLTNFKVDSISRVYATKDANLNPYGNNFVCYVNMTITNSTSNKISLYPNRDESGDPGYGVRLCRLLGDSERDEDNTYYYDITKSEDVAKIAKAIEAPAKRYITDNKLSRFPVQLKIDMLAADLTDVKSLYEVHLCDTVSIYYPALNVYTSAKCTKTEYDCLLEQYTQLDFSNASSNLAFTYAQNIDTTKRSTANLSYINTSLSLVKLLLRK